MPDGRHLDAHHGQRVVDRRRVFTCDEPVGAAYVTLCECQSCGEYAPLGALIWCDDGKPRCVACAMRRGHAE